MFKALTISSEHPAFAGHFPGAPVLPGVVLLDATLHALGAPAGGHWRIQSAKFQAVVQPGDPLSLEYELLASGAIRFVVHAGERLVASGVIQSFPAVQDAPRGEQG